jgi:hypothetical protein
VSIAGGATYSMRGPGHQLDVSDVFGRGLEQVQRRGYLSRQDAEEPKKQGGYRFEREQMKAAEANVGNLALRVKCMKRIVDARC